jgi:hypothetical protein
MFYFKKINLNRNATQTQENNLVSFLETKRISYAVYYDLLCKTVLEFPVTRNNIFCTHLASFLLIPVQILLFNLDNLQSSYLYKMQVIIDYV